MENIINNNINNNSGNSNINNDISIGNNDQVLSPNELQEILTNAAVNVSVPSIKKYVDDSGETTFIWNKREYRLSDLQDKNIPEYDLDTVVSYMLIDWSNVLHDLCKADLEEVCYAREHAHTYFTQSIGDSEVWEVAVTEALVDVTGDTTFQDWEYYMELFGIENEEFKRYYEAVHDKIFNALNDASEQFVKIYAENRFNVLIKELENANIQTQA